MKNGAAAVAPRHHTRRTAARAAVDREVLALLATAGFEALEERSLLSASVATPDFLIHRPTGSGTTIRRPAASAGPSGVTPAEMIAAYNIDNVYGIIGDGAGQTIAIIDAYNAPTITSDLATFDARFGLAAPPSFKIVNQTGGTTLPGTDPAGPGDSWAIETSLDVEWAHAVAPGANILLIEANSASDSDLFTAVDTARNALGVTVVSMSWGGGESSSDTSLNSHFTTPSGHPNVTFVASSGDDGAYGTGTHTKIVEYPAASPNVIAVGGTTLSTNAAGDYLGESAWGNGTSSASLGGAGGGISTVEAQPAYQKGVVTQSTTKRTVPDVAFDADPNSGVPVIDTWDLGASTPWEQVGGTSLAAPCWAGIIAIADQGRVTAGLSTLDSVSALTRLYVLPSSDFHDITSGNNGYAAGVGYDLVTGLGTPVADQLIPGLVSATAPTPTPTPSIGTFTVGPTSVLLNAGTPVTLTAGSVTTTGGVVTQVAFYRESNGSTGLQTSDTFLGYATLTSGSWTLSTSTVGLPVGTTTYYAVATNDSDVSSATLSATLTITAPAPANDNFASGTVLIGTSTSVSGTNINATKQTGEPSITTNTGGHSVWYTWTAAASGTVSITTAGSNFDTLLGVFTGSSVSALAKIASNDDVSRNNLTSSLSFSAVAGTTYHIAVDGYNAATGNITVNLSQTVSAITRPTNDNFSGAVGLSGLTATWNGTNVAATIEAGEPFHAGNVGGHSVWLAWTAPSSGSVAINTHGSNFDTLLGVYVGSSVSTLTRITSNDDDPAGGTLTSAVHFNAVAGVTYYIAVDGYNGATGSIVLNVLA